MVFKKEYYWRLTACIKRQNSHILKARIHHIYIYLALAIMLPQLLEVNFTACIQEELVLVPSRSLIATLSLCHILGPSTNKWSTYYL